MEGQVADRMAIVPFAYGDIEIKRGLISLKNLNDNFLVESTGRESLLLRAVSTLYSAGSTVQRL